MLRNVKALRGYAIRATDGVIGEVDDFYFDDEDWAIRYLVVDTGSWLPRRKVLISPLAVGHLDRPTAPAMGRSEPDRAADWTGLLQVSLTKAQVDSSPDIDTRKPVSRQQEAAYFGYYAYPHYWGGGGLWGMGAYPGSLTTEDRIEGGLKSRRTAATQTFDDCHLYSCQAVLGHHVHATDGDIGHVKDFLVDDHTWAIRYLIVDTSNWWGGHQVLVAPQWIEGVSRSDAKVSVDLTRQGIKDAPPYDAAGQLDRQQEQGIYEHHGRPDYWTTKADRDAASLSAK